VDHAVAEAPHVAIGSGIRGSKICPLDAMLAEPPTAQIRDRLGASREVG
jgi:hypothetical protein